jgi:phage tail-like protein
MIDPFVPFRFQVSLFADDTDNGLNSPLCNAEFSEASGLEATMTPKTVREGGNNLGAAQLAGPTAYGTLSLKRGVTDVTDLWRWFDLVTAQERYDLRLQAQIDVVDVLDSAGQPHIALRWTLQNVLPVKFKAPDLAGTSSQVAIEEVQLVFEGLERRSV